MYKYIPVCTSTYLYVLVCTSTYQYIHEVKTWLWNFGRGKPRLGGLTVEETAMQKKSVKEGQAKRSAETRRRRREDGA